MIIRYFKTERGYLLVKSRDDLIVFELSQASIWVYDRVPATIFSDESFDLPLTFNGELGTWEIELQEEKLLTVNVRNPQNGDMVCAFSDKIVSISDNEKGST